MMHGTTSLKKYYCTSKQPALKRPFHIPVVTVVKKTAFCFRETVAIVILRYLAYDQPRKTTNSGLDKQLKVATEEHGWLKTLRGKVLRRSASRAEQASETTRTNSGDYTVP